MKEVLRSGLLLLEDNDGMKCRKQSKKIASCHVSIKGTILWNDVRDTSWLRNDSSLSMLFWIGIGPGCLAGLYNQLRGGHVEVCCLCVHVLSLGFIC